jgi:hypothetical protein
LISVYKLYDHAGLEGTNESLDQIYQLSRIKDINKKIKG